MLDLTADLSPTAEQAPIAPEWLDPARYWPRLSAATGHLPAPVAVIDREALRHNALDMLVRNAADELGEFGVRVNAVRPGLVPTDASQSLDADEGTRADYLAQMPLARTGTTDDIAAAVRFLLGDESAWITGQCFGVDGGHSLRRGPDLDGLIGASFRPTVEALMHGATR